MTQVTELNVRRPPRLALVTLGHLAVYEGRRRLAHFTVEPTGTWLHPDQVEEQRTAYFEGQAKH